MADSRTMARNRKVTLEYFALLQSKKGLWEGEEERIQLRKLLMAKAEKILNSLSIGP
jgi:hypothetical protein